MRTSDNLDIHEISFTLASCPRCFDFHVLSVTVPPVMETFVPHGWQYGGIRHEREFRCPSTGKTFKHEIIYYRLRSKLAIIDSHVWPYEYEDTTRLDPEHEWHIAVQLGEGDAFDENI